MSSPTKIIFFDFDGVLVNTLGTAHSIMQWGQPHLTLADYRKKFEGNINDSINLDKPIVTSSGTGVTHFFQEYTPRLLQLPLIPGIDAVTRELAALHPLYIISSSASAAIATFLQEHDLRQCFTSILGNDVDRSKVKKFKMVLADVGLTPADSIFITDTLGDIREADEVGIATIAVTWGYHDQATLERGTPYALVTRADEIIPHIESFFTKAA